MIPAPPERVERIIYLGSPAPAVPPLMALHEAGIEIPLVVTRADARRRRGGRADPTAVKAAALELGLRVEHDLNSVAEVDADLGVVVAYGRIIPLSILESVPMVNLHFSLLPRWRGAAPVERALLAGDAETGVCVMAVEEGLDTGAIYRRRTEPIRDDDTLESLRDRLVVAGTELLVDAVCNGFGPATPQVGDATYADKIRPEDRRIDWSAEAVAVDRQVRLGGAWTDFRGDRLKVHRAAVAATADGPPGSIDGLTVACGSGGVVLERVQPAGKGVMDAAAWRNGAQPADGERLGSS